MSVVPSETWKPVYGFEGFYEVSDHGRIRSLDRVVQRSPHPQTIHGRVLKGSTAKSGHIQVRLKNAGKGKSNYVHRIVYEAFIGPIPKGLEVRHMNGIPGDNRLVNLRIGTRREQRLDDIRNGVHHQSKQTHCKRGHPLVEPYLEPRRLSQGYRICWPCKLGSMAKRHRGLDESGVRALADERFESMKNGTWKPKPRRNEI